MSKCPECGLYSLKDNTCAWFKKILNVDEIANSENCTYFIKINFEDDIPLTQHQHLLLKQEDVAGKKMKM
jgi:hypothetical protein